MTASGNKLTLYHLAKVAHEINRAQCQCEGRDPLPLWDDLDLNIRKGWVFGVVYLVRTNGVDHESLHRELFKRLVMNGYRFAEKADDDALTHPGCKPFNEMPPDYQRRLILFFNLVKELKAFADS